MELRHARVEPGESRVVVAGVAVVATDAQGVGEARVVRGDEAAFAGDERLRGSEAEHFGDAERSDRNAVEARTQRVCGVEHHGNPVLARITHRLDLALYPALAEAARHENRVHSSKRP